MSRRHLFVALADTPWGELLHAVRVATQLERAGDRVVFTGPPSLALGLRETPFRLVSLGRDGDSVVRIRDVIARERCDAVILADVALTYAQLEAEGADATFVDSIGVPVLGLDIWDLECTNLLMERGSAGFIVSRHTRDVTRRLIPSPMIRPTGWRDPLSAGVYASLPELPSLAPRAELRARLGIGTEQRLMVLATAPWQHPGHHTGDAYVARLTRLVPELLARGLLGLGPELRLLHIGPLALPALAATLGGRYAWLRPPRPADFIALLAAGDALLSCNSVSPTIATAALVGVPVLLGVNSFGGNSRDEIAAALPFALSPATLAWLTAMAPLHPFRVWPYGLHRFATPIVQDNPCVEMTRRFEILDEAGFVAEARALLWDADAVAAARARMAQCLAAVRQLPGAVAVVAHHLAQVSDG